MRYSAETVPYWTIASYDGDHLLFQHFLLYPHFGNLLLEGEPCLGVGGYVHRLPGKYSEVLHLPMRCEIPTKQHHCAGQSGLGLQDRDFIKTDACTLQQLHSLLKPPKKTPTFLASTGVPKHTP